MNKKDVKDFIGDEYLQWKEGDKIIISTPTGSGKTTFVVSELLKYAVVQRKHIIYYCNRRVLYEQFKVRSKEDIEKFFKNCAEIKDIAAEYLHILTYQSSELKRNYPNVSIKDDTTGNTIIYKPEDILFYIFDEAHYFLNDALINAGTNFWYEKKFEYGISVFLTATPKPLIALFLGWDQLSTESNGIVYKEYKLRDRLKERAEEVVPKIAKAFTWDCGKKISVKMPSNKELADATIRCFSNPLKKWFQPLEEAYRTAEQAYKIYTFDTDYSYVEPVYFSNFEEILTEIKSSNDEKWLIFVDDEIEGSNLATRIEYGEKISAAFISSDTAKRKGMAMDMYNQIVAKRSFPVRVLIATSVLDCGIDIEDIKVKNVVIVSDDETTFLQMLGRKRVAPGERIRLFIKMFNFQMIQNRYNQCTKEIRFLLKLCLKNELDLIRAGRSTVYRDGNTYGSALSANDLNRLLDEFITIAKPALVKRIGQEIEADCNGHVKDKPIRQLVNRELHLLEYDYSKTALLNLVYRMHGYRCAMSDYRNENVQFSKLCAHVYTCLMLTRTHSINDDLTTTLMIHPQITADRAKRFPFLMDRKPTVTEVDCRSHVERDSLFFLRYQLRWIGKEYDVSCWLGYNSKMTALIGYMDSVVESDKWLREDDVWHEQREFARECLNRILVLPEIPNILLKDKSRYLSNSEKYPEKNKLEKCFKDLSLPYKIKSRQQRYEGKRKTCWKVCKYI